MAPKVSVVIPTYNAENQITQTLGSVFNQSFSDFEIIVINDGSTDNTLKALEKFGTKIHVINKKNGGVSSARNTGIKAAKGKYIAFLDSDDFWHPEKLHIQVDVMEQNPDWLLSYTKWFMGSLEQRDNMKFMTSEVGNCSFEEKETKDIFLHPYLGTCSVLILREFCLSIDGYNEQLSTAEDIDLYLRTTVKGKIGFINENLAWVIDIAGSLGSSLTSYRDNLAVIDHFLTINPELVKPLKAINTKVRAKIYHEWGKDLLWQNFPVKALPVLMRAQFYRCTLQNTVLIFKAIIKSILLPFTYKKN